MKKLIFGLFITLVFFNCKRGKPSWDADYLIPLVNAHLNINHLTGDTLLQSNADSSYKFAFDATLFNFTIDTLLKSDTVITNIFPAFNTVYLQPGAQIYSQTSETPYKVNDVQLRNVSLLQGKIQIVLNSNFTQPIQINFSLPKTSKYGIPFSQNIILPKSSNGNLISTTAVFDLSGYNFDLTGLNNNKVNTITQAFTVSLANTALPDSVKAGQYVQSTLSFKNMIPYSVDGYFGSKTYTQTSNSTSSNLFGNFNPGNFNLQDANVTLKLINNLGVDVKTKINTLNALNSASGNQVALSNANIYQTQNLSRATKTGVYANPTIPFTKTIALTSTNSNIKQFVEVLPTSFNYDASVVLNPLGNISGNSDFAFYNKGIKAIMSVDIPLAFSASNMSLIQTIDFNGESIANEKNLNSGILKLSAKNLYPFQTKIQCFLLDNNAQIIDSLFASSYTIAGADLDANLIAHQYKTSNVDIDLSKVLFEKLKLTRKIKVVAHLNTTAGNNLVKFYDYYDMFFNVVADINYAIN